MTTVEQARAALDEMVAERNNAVAEYSLNDLADTVPATSPIALLLNAGYVVRIPYRRKG